MKNSLVTLGLLFTTCCAFAQTGKWWVLAGANESNFYNYNYYTTPSSSITGFHLAVLREFKLGKFSLLPGLQYASIGGNNIYNMQTASTFSSGIYNYSVKYLQVPVNIIYNIDVACGQLFFGGGPYIGFGLSGKTTQTGDIYHYGVGTVTYVNTVSSYTFSNSDNPDIGLNVIAGIHFKNKLLLTLGYWHGLKNLYTYGTNAYDYAGYSGVKNSVTSISVGYSFL